MPATKLPDAANELAKLACVPVGCSVVQARHWIRTNTLPRNPLVAKAWSKALASAKAKLAKAAS